MSNFAIVRIAKHKNLGGVLNLAKHHTRELECDHINTARTSLNIGPKFGRDAVDAISKRIEEAQEGKKKFRSDAVKVLEYMCTASPEWWQKASKTQREGFISRTRGWLEKRHPGNVAALWVHYDETSPHVHAFIVPLDKKGVLNAKSFVGGREKLTALQDEFANVVGQPLGLDRGLKKSGARHTRVRDFWQALDGEEAPKPTRADYVKAALGVKTPAIEKQEKQATMGRAGALLHTRARKANRAVVKQAKEQKAREFALQAEAATLAQRETQVKAREQEQTALRARVAHAEKQAGEKISKEAREALGIEV